MTKFVALSVSAIVISLALPASAHEADFEHGHVYPEQQPAASAYTNQPKAQPTLSSSGTINPLYGGPSARDNHRYLTTYKVKTSVNEALEELKAEEKALKRRDYKNNTTWIDGHRDAYKDDIDELSDIQKQVNALLADQTEDALVGHPDGKPSQWRVGPYDKPYVKGDKWLTLDELKEFFRPKSRRNGQVVTRAKSPKTPKVKTDKKNGPLKPIKKIIGKIF